MDLSRRNFMGAALFAAAGTVGAAEAPKAKIQGLDETKSGADLSLPWEPYADGGRKIRVGIAGEGVCSFGSAFGYQNHPYVEVVACTDLDPAKCRLLQERVKAQKTYPSCEEMIKHAAEDKLEAVYIATDAPSHVHLAIMALEHGLNVASAVPAFLGEDQLEYIPKLLDAVTRSGKLYQMNETTAFRNSCFAMRKLYEAGKLGAITYTEGEYFHPGSHQLDGKRTGSYNGWREGLPPQFYPTHSNGYYTCVTHGSFTEVASHGIRSDLPDFKGGANAYGSPFASEIALFKTSDNSTARMAVVWDAPGYHGEVGRIHGTLGSYTTGFHGLDSGKKIVAKVNLLKPLLPPGVDAGAHGGSHGYLTDDFLRGILVPGHKVCVDLKTALDTTLAGVYAHISAEKGGETLKIPQI